MSLTDTAIRNAKPSEKLYRLTDAHGLCIEITPNGSKLWRYRYRFDGKAKMMALGSYPTISLLKARQKRDEARQLQAEDIDPSEHRKTAKIAQKVAGLTFELLAQEWFDYNSPRWAIATANKAEAYLKSDLLPALGKRPVKAITRPELVDLLRKIEGRGAFNVAKKTRQWLSQIFRFGLAKGALDSNPATDLDVVAALAPRTTHHPHVAFDELPELLEKLEATRCHAMTRYAVRLLLLTGVRPGELRKAPWAEFDLDTATWTIPAERMKARRPHVVPLPHQAITILRQLKEITGRYSLAFAGSSNPERPMSENTVNKALKLAGYEGKQTGHGFRHLLSTELNGRGYNKDWVERQLAHGDSDDMRATYNHAAYLKQRRKMMQEWADSIAIAGTGTQAVKARRMR
ncbi:tyrosine-type recombinase/integrase [Pseudomonas sp. N040]|uniref:tyrosine-type recombinase/integrase n=1 Tax=Pseudomonas sp. N040 TaxID=2785325 RepID=UPI0018A2722C|nr:integrase arm-type DNA-binding domain-containing protein [Pseudomonas sp. N040]MBF7731125.1 tyrosine-type recombinase/integrase [Pseudomonas sp. N040]MBW7014768.1 tyrosine-type recombinase/integrase [Pseudomonas sp. N040]